MYLKVNLNNFVIVNCVLGARAQNPKNEADNIIFHRLV